MSKPAIEVSPESLLPFVRGVASTHGGKPVALVQPPGVGVGLDHIQPEFGDSQSLVGKVPGPVKEHRSHALAPMVRVATDPFDNDVESAAVFGAEL